jgi:acetyl esterase/lipase
MAQTAPTPECAGSRDVKDIVYAGARPAASLGHRLDLYLPPEATRPAPVVLWTHGSAWMAENGRDGADLIAAHLNPRGFAVAGVAIRSSANARFPAQLYDVKAAIRWLRLHAREYALDPQRFGIVGDSSGGWTAAMAGVTGDVPELEGDVGLAGPSSSVQAMVPLYPPTDFLRMDAHMPDHGVVFNQMMGLEHGHADPRSPESLLVGGPIRTHADAVRRASPLTYAGRESPPCLLIHGQQDPLVPYNQSELLYAALSAAGADVTFVTLPKAGHGPVDAFLTDPAVYDGAFAVSSREGRHSAARPVVPSWEMIAGFFEQHLMELRE